MKYKYIDDDDRSYGATGMAISLVVWDADDMLASISLDCAPNDMMELRPEYYFTNSPGLSAKAVWNQMLNHFQITTGMMLGNLLCRKHVHKAIDIDEDGRRELLQRVSEEGRDSCSLEEDEAERIFNKSYDYLEKIFRHAGVCSVADDLARQLKARRTMTHSEVMEVLNALRML